MQNLNKGEVLDLVYVNQPELDLHFVQAESSMLRLHIIHLPQPDVAQSLSMESNVVVEQNGAHCITEIYSLSYLTGQSLAKTHTHVLHNVADGTSLQLVKFVLGDCAKGEFYGELKILPNAQRIDARQTNRNLLLSTDAVMRTRPQLEIYADDVKASHGATTGQLDESALFYMQQRCIDPDTGRRMLLRAFMGDIIDTIRDEQQRQTIEAQLDRCAAIKGDGVSQLNPFRPSVDRRQMYAVDTFDKFDKF